MHCNIFIFSHPFSLIDYIIEGLIAAGLEWIAAKKVIRVLTKLHDCGVADILINLLLGEFYLRSWTTTITPTSVYARSLLPKFDHLRAISVAESPDVICVVETWLSNSITDGEIGLPNYQCVRCDRDRHGGGVLMYIKSSLAFDRLYPDFVGIELLIVCVSSYKSSSKLCLAVYYRPPSSSVDSFGFLSSALMSLNPTVFDHFILLGDFNVNYFCSSSSLYSHLTYSLTPFQITSPKLSLQVPM